MWVRAAIASACAVALGACNLVLGLDPPVERNGDAGDDHDDGPKDATNDAELCTTSSSGHDEDHDGIADRCDNCPNVANPIQEHVLDDDPVGDACDPRPTLDGDRIVYFAGFDALPDDATLLGSAAGSWMVGGDQLRQVDATVGLQSLARLPLNGSTSRLIETQVHVDSIFVPNSDGERAVGVWALIDNTQQNPRYPGGVLATFGEESYMGVPLQRFTQITDTVASNAARGPVPLPFDAGTIARVVAQVNVLGIDDVVVKGSNGGTDRAQIATGLSRIGDIGLYTSNAAVSFDYVIVYEIGAP